MYKSFKEYLNESRKNPHLNPKIPAYVRIKERLDRTNKKIKSIKNLFVSFTVIEKLGINPKSGYDTPIGIYSYPAEYVIKHVNEDDQYLGDLPFAGNSPFVNVFEAKGNIILLNKMTSNEANKLYAKISKYYADEVIKYRRKVYSGVDLPEQSIWKDAVDKVEYTINDANNRAKFSNIIGGRFWYVTLTVAGWIADFKKQKVTHAWNNLFREIGIDGCIDSGKGIIHTSEPTQAVFFHKNAIQQNQRYDNKWSKQTIDLGIESGEINKEDNTSITAPPKTVRMIKNQLNDIFTIIKKAENIDDDELKEIVKLNNFIAILDKVNFIIDENYLNLRGEVNRVIRYFYNIRKSLPSQVKYDIRFIVDKIIDRGLSNKFDINKLKDVMKF